MNEEEKHFLSNQLENFVPKIKTVITQAYLFIFIVYLFRYFNKENDFSLDFQITYF